VSALDDAEAMFAAAERVRVLGPSLAAATLDRVEDGTLKPRPRGTISYPTAPQCHREIAVAREHGFRLFGGPGWVRYEDPDNPDWIRWESR
jgi:hypothetical protein